MRRMVIRPTIKEVASMAGVSTQTVSRVINERPDGIPLAHPLGEESL